jgi:hypothetical protein
LHVCCNGSPLAFLICSSRNGFFDLAFSRTTMWSKWCDWISLNDLNFSPCS